MCVLSQVQQHFYVSRRKSNLILKPQNEGYFPNAEMLQAIQSLKKHKANTFHVLETTATYATIVAVDIETTARHFNEGEIALVSVYSDQVQQVTTQVADVADMLKDNRVLKVFHNAAFDVTWLKAKGYKVNNYTDTMVMAQVVHNTTKSVNSLQALSYAYLGEYLDKRLQHEGNWKEEVTEIHKQYALKDAEVTYRLYIKLSDIIRMKHLDLVLYREIQALPAIVELNLNGLPFQYDEWARVLEQIEEDAAQLEQEIRAFFQLPELLLTSPAQLLQAFKTIGIELPSTKEEDLIRFEGEHPIVAKLCKYKKLKKRVSTYGEKLNAKIHDDGRIYGNWRLIGTDTARMSCKEPNLQGLPSQAKAFVKAPQNHSFIIADYSTIELRILAEITQDAQLLCAFQNREDLHKKTAQGIFDVNEALNVTTEQRQIGKVINFGLIYGMSSYGLQKKITAATGKAILLSEAEYFRKKYFELYPGVLRYQNEMLKAEMISTLGGRYWSEQTTPLKQGAIARYNYPIQGTGAEGLKESLAILLPQLPPKWKLVAVVHDEIVLQVPQEEVDQAEKVLKDAMIQGMAKLIPSIPIEIDVKCSSVWTK